MKRYFIAGISAGLVEHEEDREGTWVRYEDAERTEARVALMEEALRQALCTLTAANTSKAHAASWVGDSGFGKDIRRIEEVLASAEAGS